MFLPFLLVVLRNVAEIVALRMIEGAFVLLGLEDLRIPHYGLKDPLAGLRSLAADELRPIGSPSLLRRCLIIHAIHHMVMAQRKRERLEEVVVPAAFAS